MLELPDLVLVVIEAAQRSLTICEIAHECEPYVEGFVSYSDVKQVCMSLLVRELISLDCADPLTFHWRNTPDSQNLA